MADLQNKLDRKIEEIDQHWRDYANATDTLVAECEQVVRDTRGVTGLDLTPGAHALIGRILAKSVAYCDDLVAAHDAQDKAKTAEAERDALLERVPPKPGPTHLEQVDRQVLRASLKSANDRTVRAWLNELTDPAAKREWASVMLGWVEADGNTHNIISLLREYATVQIAKPPSDLNAGVGPSSTYTHVG